MRKVTTKYKTNGAIAISQRPSEQKVKEMETVMWAERMETKNTHCSSTKEANVG